MTAVASYDIRPVMRVWSGHAPMVLHQLWIAERAAYASTDLADVRRVAQSYTLGIAVRTVRRKRCHATRPSQVACRRWIYLRPGEALDAALGWRGYCDACVAVFRGYCLTRYRRLPGPGEFFCPYCLTMRTEAERCPHEADGRRRIRCRVCRHQQVVERRRERARVGRVLH